VVAACGPGHPALPPSCGPHRLRLVESDRPLPRAAAANAGLDAAHGQWITFLDDDDWVDADHVAGLVAAARAHRAQVVYGYADAVFADGRHERVGRPFSLAELYERNYVHLSAALFAAALVRAGWRFDETLDILEDWDFVLQLVQHGAPAFVPRQSFHWRADAGSSGAGAAHNHDPALFAACRDRVYAKWQARRDALAEAVTAALQQAIGLAQSGDAPAAERLLRQALAWSPNDPHVLNLLAMLQRRQGRLDEAHASQALAVAVRPHDPAMLFNLALVAVARRDAGLAQRCCDQALALDSTYVPAQRLRHELAAAAGTASSIPSPS
jgi:tetratricopeptide (TPR) repeat protein